MAAKMLGALACREGSHVNIARFVNQDGSIVEHAEGVLSGRFTRAIADNENALGMIDATVVRSDIVVFADHNLRCGVAGHFRANGRACILPDGQGVGKIYVVFDFVVVSRADNKADVGWT